jgi:hypothetical protein
MEVSLMMDRTASVPAEQLSASIGSFAGRHQDKFMLGLCIFEGKAVSRDCVSTPE